MPAWMTHYAAAPNVTVSSGCSTNAAGNVNCDPAAMARAAATKTGLPVSLEAYTLARYVTSEVGTRAVGERVAVAQAAVNRVHYVDRTGSVLNLLLYRQKAGHPNRGFYGPIHGDGLSAPYGRWAATSRDPALSNLMIAIDVLSGKIPPGFAKGADDQYGPEILVARQGLAVTQNGVKTRGADRKYWVGPLPGVDHQRTFLYTFRRDIDPKSDNGKLLIARGVAAMAQPRPNWSGLPTCPEGSAIPAIPGGSTTAAVIGGAVLATAAVVGAAVWRRRQDA
jgi:hypothetical protein